MIRFLFLVIISAIVLALMFFRFKKVPMAKKMTLAGGGLAAAAFALLLQSGFAWYMPVLALVGASLAAAMIYMKVDEREELEKQRSAEERKERRQSVVEAAASKAVSEPITAPPSAKNTKEPESIPVREKIQERETIPASEPLKQPEKIQLRETIKVPDDEKMPEKPFGMQSIQPVGKER